jgi:hypothetical protein
MKKYLLGAVLAAGLAIAFLPQQASAYWATKVSYRWDPCTCSYVCYRSCCWVPDCDPCYTPPSCDPCYDPYGGYGSYESYGYSSYHGHHGRFDHGHLRRR